MCDEKMGSCGAEGGSVCGGHHHSCGRKHLLCLLIALVVGVVVFCAGVKVGEMKAYYGGWGYQQGYYPSMMNYGGYGYGMMRNWNGGVVPASQVVSTSQQ